MMDQLVYQHQDRSLLEEIPIDGFNGKSPAEDGDKLIEATLTALETGSLMPLIKQELKYTILSRRIAEGKGEIKVNFSKPRKMELTPEEILKVEKRKEQNRIASRKFRRKQKQISPMVVKRVQTLEADNTQLEIELGQLKKERNQLLAKVNAHMKSCVNLSFKIS